MKYIRFHLYTLLLLFLLPMETQAQGCSDAGFCTMGALKPNQSGKRTQLVNLRSIEITHYFAYTNASLKNGKNPSAKDYFQSIIVDANVGIGKKYSFQLKLPYNATYGILANTSGIGDISYGLTRSIIENTKLQIGATIGGKIPTGSANLKFENRPLPMYYQPGLGTWDGIAGVGINFKNILFATGIQHPFNANNNTFVWKPWNSTPDSAEANHYLRTNNFMRGTDVMFRLEYNLRFANWNVHAGILNIYRINKDKFRNSKGVYEEIKYTNGLVSSLVVGGSYRFSTKSAIKIVAAWRINERDAYAPEKEKFPNPDGLKRFFVNTISYEYKF